jgi:hypothetical protein
VTYEQDISAEEANLIRLRAVASSLKIPRKNIAWQFGNARGVPRNIARSIILTRSARRRTAKEINKSNYNICSLRDAIFARDNPPVEELL